MKQKKTSSKCFLPFLKEMPGKQGQTGFAVAGESAFADSASIVRGVILRDAER